MANKRSRAHHKKNLIAPPENWQEAMDRGVFLLNEHNRGFIEYVSPVVHLPSFAPVSVIGQTVLFALMGMFGIGWLYSLSYDSTRVLRISGNEPYSAWWFLLGACIIVLVAGIYIVFRVNSDLKRNRALVLEGRIIFVPIRDCVVVRRFLGDVMVNLSYDFESPTTNQPLQGRFLGNAIGTRWCPAKGMVAAILYKDDKDYQAL